MGNSLVAQWLGLCAFTAEDWSLTPGGSDGKESACNAGYLGSIPGLGRFLWRRAWQLTPAKNLPGESTWTEEPGGLQFVGLQRVGHD